MRLLTAFLAVALFTSRNASADPGIPAPAPEPLPSPIDGLLPDIADAFGGFQFLYLTGAVAAVAVMSPTGADHSVRVGVQRHLRVPAWGDAAYYGGYILPVVIPASLYVTGLLSRDHRTAGAGSAAIQALALTEAVTVILKVGTGRPFPLHGQDPDSPDRLGHPEYAREFSPFGFAGRYAWPSGHTSAAISIAAALTAYYDDYVAAFVAYPIAGAVAFGMLTGDHHWASDIVSGGLIGQGIGWSVGKSFRARGQLSSDRVQLIPLISPGIQGLALGGAW
jgi:membrane-associated phospholipid phosphatase